MSIAKINSSSVKIASDSKANNRLSYVIYRNGKRYNNMSFDSYEKARKYAIRKVRAKHFSLLELEDGRYPTLSRANFKIVLKTSKGA